MWDKPTNAIMRKLSDEQKIEIVHKYNSRNNANCAELGREYGIRGDSIRDLLLRRGVKLKTRSQAMRTYNLDEAVFDKIDSEDKAYFLGLLYADGYNNEKRGEIHLSLQEEDRHILETLREIVSSDRPLMFVEINKKDPNRKNVYRFDISSRRISKNLKSLGCPQAKSFILNFPNKDQVPEDLLRHFIRGYFDGDGCFVSSIVKNNYRQYSIGVVSTKNFCEALQNIVKNVLDVSSFLSVRHKDRINTTRNFHISGNKQVIKFLSWLYEDSRIYLNRKFNKYKKEKSNYEKLTNSTT